MKIEKKLTLYKLKNIIKKNGKFKDMHESTQWGQKRYTIYFEFDDVIHSDTFKELKKFNNDFFIMTSFQYLILVIYK